MTTTKKVYVTSAQRAAAKAMVKRSAATGREVSDAVHKIANAKIEFVAPGEKKAATRA